MNVPEIIKRPYAGLKVGFQNGLRRCSVVQSVGMWHLDDKIAYRL